MSDPLMSRFYVTGIFIKKYYNVATGSPAVDDVERFFLPVMSILGLGIPVPLAYTSDTYRVDGSLFLGMNIQNRTVTIQIPVLGDVATKKTEIYNIFSQDPRIAEHTRYDLCLELNIGKILTLKDVVLLGAEPDVKSPVGQVLTLTIFCPNPIIYGAPDTFSSGAPSCPLCDSTHVVTVYGTWVTYPVITLVGRSATTTITNVQTGRYFTLDVPSVGGETITITTQPGPTQGIVGSVSGNMIADVIGGSLDLALDPTFGTNTLTVVGNPGGGAHIDIVTFVMTMSWYNSYIGV